MGKQRTWYTYQFKRGNKVLHGGITEDPITRENQHQRNIDPKGHLRTIGKAKTEESARQWEEDMGYS